MAKVKEQKNKKEIGVRLNVTEKVTDVDYKVLLEPIVTEKSHVLMGQNKYVFRVLRKADKKQIKSALQNLYGVKVDKVAVINIPEKSRQFGRIKGVKSGFKKAIATLKVGDKIELFQGA